MLLWSHVGEIAIRTTGNAYGRMKGNSNYHVYMLACVRSFAASDDAITLRWHVHTSMRRCSEIWSPGRRRETLRGAVKQNPTTLFTGDYDSVRVQGLCQRTHIIILFSTRREERSYEH